MKDSHHLVIRALVLNQVFCLYSCNFCFIFVFFFFLQIPNYNLVFFSTSKKKTDQKKKWTVPMKIKTWTVPKKKEKKRREYEKSLLLVFLASLILVSKREYEKSELLLVLFACFLFPCIITLILFLEYFVGWTNKWFDCKNKSSFSS